MDFRHLLVSEPNIYSLAIHGDAVELLLVQKTVKGLQKKVYKKISLPKGVIEEGILKKPDEFAKVVETCFGVVSKKILRKQVYVMVTIPDNTIVAKRYEFSDRLEESEINDSIGLNENIQLPYRLASSYYDSEPRKSQKDDWQDLLFVQVKKTVINPYIEALNSIKLDVIIVECETLSFVRTLDFKVLDSCLIIKEDTGGFRLAYVLEKELKFFSYRKILDGGLGGPKKDQLSKIIEYFLNYLEVEFGVGIKKIMYVDDSVSSESKMFLDVLEKLKAKGREIEQVFLGDYVKADIKAVIEKKGDLSMLTIFGLGQRSLISRDEDKIISLLPVGTEEAYLIKRSVIYGKMIFDMVVFSCLVLVILFGFSFVFVKYYLGVDMHESFQSSSLRFQSSNIVDLENKAREFVLYLNNAEQVNQYKNKISQPLDDLQQLITPGITVTGISAGGEQSAAVIVSGIGLTRGQVIDFQDKLIASEVFKDVDLPLSSLSLEKNVIFKITMKRK